MLQRAPSVLLEQGRPVRLGGRALELLTLLVQRAGEVVSKAELMAGVWPNKAVDDINLRVHIAALRRALGDGQHDVRYIANVAGRGYTFVSAVGATDPEMVDGRPEGDRQAARRHNLPAGLTRLVGRDEPLARVRAMLAQRRFVSIVGPGGVGKTSLALDIASRLVGDFPQGVWLVELSNVVDPMRVAGAIAEGIDFVMPFERALEALVAFIETKSLLILLDNCEHVADEVARLAVRMLKSSPGLRLLVTSREPMQAEGEWVQRLAALALPAPTATISVADALSSPAVQLFVERAIAYQDGFELTAVNAAQVTSICRRVDGLPFAIELAAARVDAFGVAGTLRMLEERSDGLSGDSRARLPRHRTMGTLLDWSYDLLTHEEQTLLRRLAVFRGDFPVEWAAIVGAGQSQPRAVVEALGSLASKSLLMARTSQDDMHYFMLQTTRDYMYEKFRRSSEVTEIRRRHAALLRDFFADTEPAWDSLDRAAWLSRYGRTMDDVRFALEWALGEAGDPLLGIELTLATVLLGCQLSLLQETHDWISRAIEVLPLLANRDLKLEVRLRMARAVLLTQTQGPSRRLTADFEFAAAMSPALPASEESAELANGMWVHAFTQADYPAALAWAEQVGAFAKLTHEPFYEQVYDRLSCLALHYLGDHHEAWIRAERVLYAPTSAIRLGLHTPAPLDRRVSMRIIKARILWMTGFADQAKEVAREAVALSRRDVAHSFAQAVCWAAIPVDLWSGDTTSPTPLIDELLEHTVRHDLAHWHEWANAYRLLLRPGPAAHHGLDAGSTFLQHVRRRDHFCTFDPDLLSAATLDRVEKKLVGWCAPEVIRVSAIKLSMSHSAASMEQARVLLERAIASARDQHALAWELRAATSLARFWIAREQGRRAIATLEPVLARMTEGFSTRDVVAATALLGTLG